MEGPVAEAKAKATPPWKQESPQSKQQKHKQTADRKAQSRVTQRQANEGKHLDVAAFDLFAGLRTVHVAAEGTRANLVLAHAAEKCPFANKIAIKNNIVETVHTDVCLLDRTWADAFVAEAIRLEARVILVIGGFPCKGLSHARGASRENLKNKDPILFWELIRILELVKRAAGDSISVRHTVENVMMDKEPEDIISQHLGERATKIAASPVCAAGRDRLFWIDFQLQPLEDETLIEGSTRNELILEPDPERIDFWDEGWGPTQSFDGTMPTLQGWQTWTREPKDPRGIHI